MIKTRVVETAIDEQGESYVFSDQEMEDKNFNLKPGQLRFFRSDIPPTRPLYDALPDNEKPKKYRDLFYHSTTTVDYIMIVRGELVMVIGDTEVALTAGDVVIQRGAAHAWHNETSDIATIMGVMIGVELPPQFHRVDTVQPE